MIRKSSAIAVAAILLSLLVHFVGLNYTPRVQPEPSIKDATKDVVAVGNAFEDVAKNLPEPIPPENATSPEPRTGTVPEPELADAPTSEVLVASSNPQRTASPDTGIARVVPPETTGPSQLDQSRVPEPETVEPFGGDQRTTANVVLTPPVVPEADAQAPKGNPDAMVAPAETVTPEPVIGSPIDSAPQRLAALPAPITATLPVTLDPELLAVPVQPTPEDAEDEPRESELAVLASPRPQLVERQPTAETLGQSDGSTEFSELLSPPLIESPLAAYLRHGTDPNVQKNGSAQSGGLGFVDSRGPGNSDVTNYAGLILVHLNRAPAVYVSAQGFATVFFKINPDGSLGLIDIIDSSGSQEVNRAAKAQVRRAAPFPRPPKGVGRSLSFIYWGN